MSGNCDIRIEMKIYHNELCLQFIDNIKVNNRTAGIKINKSGAITGVSA
jgi:hypothetical protein